jgi:hypothetical protein
MINARLPGVDLYLTTSMLNDTGSTALSLFYTEAAALGYDPNVHITRQVNVLTAAGYVQPEFLEVEIQVINYNGAPLTRWFRENAVLVQHTGSEARLSGSNVRSYLYFATTPRDSNQFLHVSRTKTGLTSHDSSTRHSIDGTFPVLLAATISGGSFTSIRL